MALTDADVNKVAERVLDLSKERADAAYETWKAEQDEKRNSPEGLAKRVAKLEEDKGPSWLALGAVFYGLLFLIVLTPSRKSTDG